uniref:Uncharacterized protein n=1 Tax=Trichogramma kaykai TaxID=54128 RepID=A0ABD2XNL2_9HYME
MHRRVAQRDQLYICIQISGQFAACVSSRVPVFRATAANRKKKEEEEEEEEEETKLDKILFTRAKRTKNYEEYTNIAYTSIS